LVFSDIKGSYVMKAELNFVPPGGGEADYTLVVEIPGTPNPGDYVTIRRKYDGATPDERMGTEDFRVRRCWWYVDIDTNGKQYTDPEFGPMLVVECEFARGMTSSKAHIANYERYAKRKGVEAEFDHSTY
jgi:hypothetical protein